ncbi:MAG: GGDEF domain-containing protein [Vicinamibacterales bacterium]
MLTGAANRLHMDATIARAIAGSADWNAELSVAMLDFDHFALVNDAAGYDAGDELLRQFVTFLRGQLTADELLFRLGGDEFVIVLPTVAASAAQARVEEIHARWLYETPTGSGGHTFSAGIADTADAGRDVRTLLQKAHKALADAKGSGRARVVATESAAVAAPVEEVSYLKKFGIVK